MANSYWESHDDIVHSHFIFEPGQTHTKLNAGRGMHEFNNNKTAVVKKHNNSKARVPAEGTFFLWKACIPDMFYGWHTEFFQAPMSKSVAGMETGSTSGSDAKRVGVPAYKATDALRQ